MKRPEKGWRPLCIFNSVVGRAFFILISAIACSSSLHASSILCTGALGALATDGELDSYFFLKGMKFDWRDPEKIKQVRPDFGVSRTRFHSRSLRFKEMNIGFQILDDEFRILNLHLGEHRVPALMGFRGGTRGYYNLHIYSLIPDQYADPQLEAAIAPWRGEALRTHQTVEAGVFGKDLKEERAQIQRSVLRHWFADLDGYKAPDRFPLFPTVFVPGTEYTRVLLRVALQFIPQAQVIAVMGTGAGPEATLIANTFRKKVYATDLNPLAVANTLRSARQEGVQDLVEAEEGDLFSSYGTRKFDLILFDAPQALEGTPPENWIDDIRVHDSGGKLLRRLVDELPAYLKPGGRLLIMSNRDIDRYLSDKVVRRTLENFSVTHDGHTVHHSVHEIRVK